MDNVLEELRDNKSFKKGSRPAKPIEGTAIVASVPGLMHAEAIPARDGSASASTSDSDDM